jgi:signal peptidase I
MSDDIPSLQPPSAAPTPAAPPGPPATDPEARNPMREVWSEWIRPFLIVLLVVSTFRSAVADWNDVPTGSMKPTILPGERIFVNKVAYDLKIPFTRVRLAQWEDPRRGDVVVLFSPADGKRLVKRVVGLPGDVVALRSNRLYVNGEEAAYTEYDDLYLDELGYHPEMDSAQVVSETVEGREHPVLWLPLNPNNATFPPTRVPPAQYFVMGDNRNQSSDSRVFGFVDRERIVGQATAVVVSIDKDGRFTPRWDRFFQGLP